MEFRTTRTALLALCAGAALIAASNPAVAAPRPGQSAIWRTTQVLQNDLFGTPSMIEGEFHVRAPATDPIGVARSFLNAQRSVIGIHNPDRELKVLSVTGPDELGMTHVKFSHRAQGVKVFGSELIVNMKGNVVTGVHGVWLKSILQPLRVTVDGEAATELAIDAMRDLINLGRIDSEVGERHAFLDLDSDPELVFFNRGLISGEKTSTVPAWQMSINGYVFFVNAVNGRVLEHFDNIPAGLSRIIYDCKHTTQVPGPTVVCQGSGCNTSDADANDAWSQFGETYDYFLNTHQRDSWDGKGGTLKGNVHYSTNYQNAYWDGQQMVFGDQMIELDVTAHELGHGVCQATANLTYKSQSGALNESYSDVWGAMVDREDWEIGEDLEGIGTIRDMCDPNAYGQPKDMGEYKRYIFYDNGGVHINSGIPNYATCLASDGGTNDGVTVKGQGREKVEKIWYRTETTKLTSSSQFSNWASGIKSACGELYGSSSTTCTEVGNALKAVGL